VYATALTVDPPQPKSKAPFIFHVDLLNTTGAPRAYTRLRVLIYPKGDTKTTGDPQSDVQTVPVGAFSYVTRAWNINTPLNCQSYLAQAAWEDNSGRRTLFTGPDGKDIELEFQVCP